VEHPKLRRAVRCHDVLDRLKAYVAHLADPDLLSFALVEFPMNVSTCQGGAALLVVVMTRGTAGLLDMTR
jgi:hypothetical protein